MITTDYSIDQLLPKISDYRTKEYCEEVISCYYNNSLRSAIVLLYSTVICDLIFKLHSLREIYNDQSSIDILNHIEKKQQANPKSSDWETDLIDQLIQRNRILTTAAKAHIDSLRNDRHLCAHPVLKKDIAQDEIGLHQPSKPSVYVHITNMLSEVLTCPVFIEKELINHICEDLDTHKAILNDKQNIEVFLKEKYLDKFSSPIIECNLFKPIWKFVFKLTNNDCRRNRHVNYIFLNLLYIRNADCLNNLIITQSEYYSNQIEYKDINILQLFIQFCNSNPKIYNPLLPEVKISIEAKIKTNPILAHTCFFLHKDINSFYNNLLSEIDDNDRLAYIMQFISEKLDEEKALMLPIAIFSRSDSFYNAEINYQRYILSNKNRFTLNNWSKVLKSIQNNNQLSGCYKISGDYKTIKKSIVKLDDTFDFSDFEKKTQFSFDL